MTGTVPTSNGNSIIVPATEDGRELRPDPASELTSLLAGRANQWRDHRNQGWQNRWRSYWRFYRGIWNPEDKNRQSERSRLIAPALANAIEMNVSELEEGIFSREVWFDITDDIADQQKQDAIAVRDALLEDMELANAKDSISECLLNAAIFGTGIIKIVVEVTDSKTPSRSRDGTLSVSTQDKVQVALESIRPDHFIPDPAGRNIEEMMGCFHEVIVPRHSVLEKIARGVYRKEALASLYGMPQDREYPIDPDDPQVEVVPSDADEVEILEWHGKVPKHMLMEVLNGREEAGPLDDIALFEEELDDAQDDDLVEAIVTIANGSTLLRAMINPFVMTDRSIVAFQFEKVPGRFWGRGVAEKGYNPQKALDAELRARIDALGFVSSPMLGVDSGRIPRGMKMDVRPGKVWLTQGPPDEILRPVGIGDINPNTFNQTQEMERMVGLGTGAFDATSQLKGSNSDNSSPQRASLLMGAFVKRARRALRNANDNLLNPVIKKCLWRYMQFEPSRYPNDYKFVVKPTLGMVAREVEQMQLTQTMAMMPDQFPQVTVAMSKGMVELSSLHNKAEIMQAVDQALAPPSPEETAKQQLLEDTQLQAAIANAQSALLSNQEIIARTRKLLAETEKIARESEQVDDELRIEMARLRNEIDELEAFREQNRLQMKRLELEQQKINLQAQKQRNS